MQTNDDVLVQVYLRGNHESETASLIHCTVALALVQVIRRLQRRSGVVQRSVKSLPIVV